VAQAIGRLGNWFNNELYGSATDLPWALKIYEWSGGRAVLGPDGEPIVLTAGQTFVQVLALIYPYRISDGTVPPPPHQVPGG
jgi:prolipoprotein diacylglyceryltransferase